ncbi:MAG: hypothetical protein DELT_00366 [Desulfovibrio sp.]
MITIDLSTRIGKIALLLAMTDETEEVIIKEAIARRPGIRAAVTFVSGMTNKINATYAKSILNAAIAGEVIKKSPNQVHAVLHASLEAFQAMTPRTSVSTSIKTKVAIVTDERWVAVAAYGDSAFSAFTNHERGGLGVMHL